MKTDKELMLKALDLLPQLKGFTVSEIQTILKMIEGQVITQQSFEMKEAVYQSIVEQWKNADY